MYGIMNLGTRKIVASGFPNRQAGKGERDLLNSKQVNNIHIIIRDVIHPKGVSKITDANFKSCAI